MGSPPEVLERASGWRRWPPSKMVELLQGAAARKMPGLVFGQFG
jgi:hypothetical protein